MATGAGLDAVVEQFLGQGGQPRQVAGHRAGGLVQGEHGLRLVLEAVAGLRLTRELEAQVRGVLAHLADEAFLRQLPTGAAEGVAWRQLAGHTLVQPAVPQGADQVAVFDADAAGAPGEDLP